MYSDELSCPSNNVGIEMQENNETIKNVASWGACSDHCRHREDCTAWTWLQWAHDCITMSGYGYLNPYTNVVSGRRDCDEEEGTFFRMTGGKVQIDVKNMSLYRSQRSSHAVC